MVTLATFFGGPPAAHESAPGRVNLLGEHTDYNDGFMLPVATPQRTEVALGPSSDDHFYFYSATLDASVSFARGGRAPPGFASYIEGCIRMVERQAGEVPPLRVYVSTSLPLGAGLSSSAALEVATLRALRTLLDLAFDDVALARMAQQAEIEYAGVRCGIMDQMAASLADLKHMLFIDARTLEYRLLQLPPRSELIVLDSGVPRTLAASMYNQRRAECDEAARQLGVAALRDIAEPGSVEACGGVGALRFGQLMNDSHASLRDDYAVSIPELEALCDGLRAHPDVFGARLTGAGFGGACVALCREGKARQAAAALALYHAHGRQGRQLIPVPAPIV